MKNPESQAQTMDTLQDAVLEFNSNLVRETAQHALKEGVDPLDAIVNGLAAGMERAGELCARGEYFLPELTMCAEAFYEGLAMLRPHLNQDAGGQRRGTVVIGTVEGDKHDIGKNLVKAMLEVAGFMVYDLGVDVRPEEFVQASIRRHAELVCLSSTMTTTKLSLRQSIDMLRLSNPMVRIMVGGSAVSERDACQWGVDGYAADALSSWRVVMQLIISTREFESVGAALVETGPATTLSGVDLGRDRYATNRS